MYPCHFVGELHTKSFKVKVSKSGTSLEALQDLTTLHTPSISNICKAEIQHYIFTPRCRYLTGWPVTYKMAMFHKVLHQQHCHHISLSHQNLIWHWMNGLWQLEPLRKQIEQLIRLKDIKGSQTYDTRFEKKTISPCFISMCFCGKLNWNQTAWNGFFETGGQGLRPLIALDVFGAALASLELRSNIRLNNDVQGNHGGSTGKFS